MAKTKIILTLFLIGLAAGAVLVVSLSINPRTNRMEEESPPQTTHQTQPREDLQQPPPNPPREGLMGVVDESEYELKQRGLMDKVAALAEGFILGKGVVLNDTHVETNKTIGIRLGFYNKTDPEVVKIVKSVIDKRAPGTPIEIFEDITIRLDQNRSKN